MRPHLAELDDRPLQQARLDREQVDDFLLGQGSLRMYSKLLILGTNHRESRSAELAHETRATGLDSGVAM